MNVYASAAEPYRPATVRTLFVAEAPPTVGRGEDPRYFYFEPMTAHDGLFRGIMRALGMNDLDIPRAGRGKAQLLARFRDAGCFLIDLSEESLPEVLKGAPGKTREHYLEPSVAGVVDRIAVLKPERVILVVAHVYRLLASELRGRGMNVPQRGPINFPGYRQQRQFAHEMALLNLPTI